jgi:hypothetical protein
MYYVFQSLMCAWPVVLFFHCVSFLRLLTSKCEHEQIMVNTWRCWLWQWSMQAHACLSCMCIQEHLFVFCSGRFWTSPSQFLGNTKKTIFNTYAFTHAIGLRRGYTIVFPSIFNLSMRIHKCVLFFLRKHIPNIYIFHRHVIAGGNTFLIHSSLQSLFGLYVGKHIRIYVLPTYSRETHARIYAFIG